ncbi:Uncharacterised protein [Vibrio cholerae]|nr:Uncharacterised protein [Vibrio cholerae]
MLFSLTKAKQDYHSYTLSLAGNGDFLISSAFLVGKC